MVTICGFSERQSKDGKPFFSLQLRGDMEMILSAESGRYYATARTASISSTFDQKTCQELVGRKLPGRITRIACEPYDFAIPETGEVITLKHHWTYSPDAQTDEEIVYEKEIANGAFTL